MRKANKNESMQETKNHTIGRREVLKGGAAGAAALAVSGLPLFNIASAASKTIKIGYVNTFSGIRAPFSETDNWVIGDIRKRLKDGMKIGGTDYKIEIIVKDTQSTGNRAVTVGQELIQREGVDMMLMNDADGAVAIGEMCDIQGIPSISTMGPWQGWFFPRGGKMETGFPWTYHYMWGVDGLMSNFVAMWGSGKTNKTIGTLYFNSPAGQAFSGMMPPAMKAAGFKEVNTGFFKAETDDFSNQIATFKNANVEIVSGLIFADHWATFWAQSAQKGFKPDICTVAGAFLFPSGVNALGERGDGMSTEIWWTPNFPFKSSLTGQSAKQLAAAWEKASGKQWTQPLGFSHSTWEVGLDVLKRSADPKDKKSIRAAINDTDLDTVIGKISWKKSPIKNVSVSPIVGGQWRRTKKGRNKYELLITHNPTANFIPTDAKFKLLSELS